MFFRPVKRYELYTSFLVVISTTRTSPQSRCEELIKSLGTSSVAPSHDHPLGEVGANTRPTTMHEESGSKPPPAAFVDQDLDSIAAARTTAAKDRRRREARRAR